MRTPLSASLLVLTSFSLLSLPIAAEWKGGDRNPTASDIVMKLAPKVRVEGLDSAPPVSSSIDMEVNFQYDSATLTSDARLALDQLGAALQDPVLQLSHFRITGHTDAVGSADYNLALSLRRAASVRDYLNQRHGIARERLEVDGQGFNRLADPQNPTSALNRRVEVTRLEP